MGFIELHEAPTRSLPSSFTIVGAGAGPVWQRMKLPGRSDRVGMVAGGENGACANPDVPILHDLASGRF
jgi:hypothetical protein